MAKKQPKAQREKEIVDAAVKEFLEKGYDGASMQSIAKRAGLTKGGLYHHFSSKEEILFAVDARFQEPVTALMERAASISDPTKGLTVFIQGYLTHWIEHQTEVTFSMLVFSKVLTTPSLWPMMDDYCEAMIAFLESFFSKGIESNRFRPHNTKSRAIALFMGLDSAAAYLLTSSQLELSEIAAHFEQVFVQDLLIE